MCQLWSHLGYIQAQILVIVSLHCIPRDQQAPIRHHLVIMAAELPPVGLPYLNPPTATAQHG
jgi:hypothetical protein